MKVAGHLQEGQSWWLKVSGPRSSGAEHTGSAEVYLTPFTHITVHSNIKKMEGSSFIVSTGFKKLYSQKRNNFFHCSNFSLYCTFLVLFHCIIFLPLHFCYSDHYKNERCLWVTPSFSLQQSNAWMMWWLILISSTIPEGTKSKANQRN